MRKHLIRTVVIALVIAPVILTACAKPPEPAELEVSSLLVTPTLVLPGQEATVEADIANVGEVQGTLTATLTGNGGETDTRPVTLAAGATDKVSFTVIQDLAGTYELSIDGMSTTLTVAEVETYSSGQYLYSIYYTSGWILDDSTPEMVSMTKAGFAVIGVEVNTLPVAASLDEFYALAVETMTGAFPNFEVISRQDVMENGVVVATEVAAEATAQGTPFRFQLLLSKTGRYGFLCWV